MSYTSFDNPPARFSIADYRDSDTFALDCTANMVARNNQIASVGTGIVTRADGTPMRTGDYAVGTPQILAVGTVVQLPNGTSTTVTLPGTWFSWVGSGGMANTGYHITWPLTLAKTGEVIYRTVDINTGKYVG